MRRSRTETILSIPPLAWYFLFLALPLSIVAASAFLERGAYGGVQFIFTLGNFARALDTIYLQIFWQSAKLALLTTLICAALGFPIAYAIATQPAKRRPEWLLLVALPSLTSLVVRIYAIRSFLSPAGFGAIASEFGLGQGPALVLFGMVSAYLPFFVLPMAAALEKFDFLIVDAARDLGESDSQILFRIVMPALKGPLGSAMILVFIPALGEFLIPDLLGGARTMLAGNLITEQFLRARDWPFGSALTLLLFLLLSLLFLIARAISGSFRNVETR